jgi:hypothetical protein
LRVALSRRRNSHSCQSDGFSRMTVALVTRPDDSVAAIATSNTVAAKDVQQGIQQSSKQ